MPMLSYEILRLPWECVGVDLFIHKSKTYIFMVDFYSFHFETQEMELTNASEVKTNSVRKEDVRGCKEDKVPTMLGEEEDNKFTREMKLYCLLPLAGHGI